MKYTIKVLLALFVLLLATSYVMADVNVLIIGSTRDSGEQHREAGNWEDERPRYDADSVAFSHAMIATELDNILSGAGLGNVNVVVEDRYRYYNDGIWGAYAYDLATWFHFPYPADVETTTRWPNLRGESGTQWDYVILIGDPYTMECTPGVYAHGVAKVAEEVAKGSAETILLMPWPGSGSSSSVAHYKDITYRVGRSGGIKVAPAGLAWQACGSPSGGSHPNNNGAYIAASTIYSRIYRQSAKVSSYSYNDTYADTANTTVNNNVGSQQYTGTFNLQNPYLMLDRKERTVHFSERGTSTEQGFKTKLQAALNRCVVGQVLDYCDKYNSNTPENDGLGWPTGRSMPIAFNFGRSGLWAEDTKAYVLNTSYWRLGFGFYFQGAWTTSDEFIGIMQEQDHDLANRMIREAPSARNIPVRTLWASIHQVDPAATPKRPDGHLSYYEEEAVGTFMYTMYSGRCPLDPEPTTPDTTWQARRVGYETAWRMGRCQTRAPGFKVVPTSATATNVTPSSSQTLSVRFVFAPTSDVTVAVTTSDRFAGRVEPSALTFTPENYSDLQTVAVIGERGSAGSYPFDVILTTSSSDDAYNGVSDSWDFMNTRSSGPTPADIQVRGNGFAITAGDRTPDVTMGTDYGIIAGGSLARTFTVANLSSSKTITLTGSPRVDLSGANGHFTLSQDAAGSVSPLSSTEFKVTYDPQSAGTHTALVSIASTDSAAPLYSFALLGTRLGPPRVESQEALANSTDAATLVGVLDDGASASMWICWGDNDGGTGSTGDWDHVVVMGDVLQGVPFFSEVSSVATNATYWFRCYATNAYGTDWSSSALTFSGTPAGSILALPVTNGLVARWDATGISGISDGCQVTAWENSANPGSYDLQHAGGSPKYRASVPELNGMPAVEFSDGGEDWFQFTKISTIQSVFWVVHDSYATTEQQFLLGDDTTYHFHSNVDKIWSSYTTSRIKDGTTEVNGIAVDGLLVDRPRDPAIISLVTSGGGVTASRVSRDRTIGRSWEGKIAEILIYDMPLSGEDEDIVGGYLSEKYGLSTSYPESHSRGIVINTAPHNISEASATLTAQLNAGNTNFSVKVYWGTTDGGDNPGGWSSSSYVGEWSNVSTTISKVVSGLNDGETYFYRFRAENAGTDAWASPSWRFVAHGAVSPDSIATPTDPAATAISTSRIDLTWSDNSTNETGFLIERSTTSGSGFSGVASKTAGSTSHSDTTVSSGVKYYYRVTATNATDSSMPSSEAFTTTPGIQATVALSNLSRTYDGSAKSATVTTEPAGLTVSVTYDGGSTAPSNVGSYAVVATVTQSGYEGNTHGTLEILAVAPAVVNAGASPATTTSASVSGKLTAGGAGTVWICWGDNEVGAGSTGDWDHVVSVGVVTESEPFWILVDSLAANATYWYRCYVSNGGGSDWSDSATSFSGTVQGNVGGGTGTASVVTISAVYAHNEKDSYGGKPEDVITGTGFDDTDPGTIPSEWPTNHPSLWRHQDSTQYREEWQSQCILDPETSINGKIGWAILDLGSVKNPLSELYVWNVREDTTRDTVSNNIYYASNPTVTPNHGPTDDSSIDYDFGSGGWTLLSSQEFNLSGKTGDDPADSIVSLGGVSARYIAIEITSNGGHADRVGLAEVGITVSTPIGAQIVNATPTGITASCATINGSVDAIGTNCAVYLNWGTSDGGTNLSSWAETAYVGSYADELASISHTLSGLIRGQTYYYRFQAGDSWASPSWQFTTPAGCVLTTNHLVPHTWMDTVIADTITDYEDEAENDRDGDGFSTWEEYWSGTNPDDGNSCLKIDAITFDGTNVQIEWESDAADVGLPPLAIESTSNLVNGAWAKVGEKQLSIGRNSWSTNAMQKRYYRLAVTAAP